MSSSLADVLLETVPERFFLSPRAAAGILRRAEKRGRELPRALAEALQALASQHPDDDRRMTRTSSAPFKEVQEGVGIASTPREPQATISSPQLWSSDTTVSSPTRSEQPDGEHLSFISENQRAEVLETPYARQLTQGGGKPGQGYPAARIGSVRRLTPTECERLQGFPDGWTIPGRTVPDTQRWGTQSPSTSLSGSDTES